MYIYIHMYIDMCMAVSRLFWCTKVVGAQEVPKQKIKNEIGHETPKNGSFS